MPRGALGDDDGLRAALFTGECTRCADETGMKRLIDPAEFWDFETEQGWSVRILAEVCALQGPHIVFATRIRIGLAGARPVLLPTMRFPVSLMPSDIESRVTRNW